MDIEVLQALVLSLAKKVKNLNKSRFEKVTSLPLEGQFDIIYLLKHDDHYDEYIWLDTNDYEMIGTTEIDLSQYATVEELYNLEVNKCERLRLTCDDNHIYRNGEVLSFVEVLSLIQNKRYYITMTLYDNISFRPSAYDGDAIWFDSTFIEDNTPNILRYIINKENRCKVDQIELPTKTEFTSLKRDLNLEITNRSNQYTQLVTAINQESLRAQGVEETLGNAISAENTRATTAEINLANSIRSEIDNLDVCIEERTFGDGESGYRKYKNGFLEQWGISTSHSGGETNFNLHTPYKNMNYSIFTNIREMGNFYHYAYPKSNSQFSLRIQDRSSQPMAVRFSWMSIGRWK